jgi:hypothetical protein
LRCIVLLLALSSCSLFDSTTGKDEAFSGSSVPPASRAVVGGVLISPGAGGETEARDLARRNCEQYHRKAEIGGAATVNGAVRLTYTCQ